MATVLKALLFSILLMPLEGKDFGKHGHVYVINEENLLEYMQNRLHELSDEKIQDVLQNYYFKQAALSLREAQEYRRYELDPSITVFQDICDQNGSVIISKGSFVNPLGISSLIQELLFFDGDNPLHVQWAKENGREAKWILVKGKPLELEKQEERPIYFDQFGFLVRKLDIQRIPAKVSQAKGSLKITIEEIPL